MGRTKKAKSVATPSNYGTDEKTASKATTEDEEVEKYDKESDHQVIPPVIRSARRAERITGGRTNRNESHETSQADSNRRQRKRRTEPKIFDAPVDKWKKVAQNEGSPKAEIEDQKKKTPRKREQKALSDSSATGRSGAAQNSTRTRTHKNKGKTNGEIPESDDQPGSGRKRRLALPNQTGTDSSEPSKKKSRQPRKLAIPARKVEVGENNESNTKADNKKKTRADKPSPKKRKQIAGEGNRKEADKNEKSDRKIKMEPLVGEADNGKLGRGKLIGAHCSIAGGLENAVTQAVSMGGRAIGLFLKSQRSWAAKPLESAAVEKFKAACEEHGFVPDSILPHGSYLLNCGSPNAETWQKSRDALLDELQRCEALGLTLYNFHPGSTCGEITVDECLDKIADCINWAHAQTKSVITVVENMSCQGNTVGGRFEELHGIIDRVKDKSRIGICLDTCHAFAAGFDLATEEGYKQFVADFDRIVGFKYLKAMHLNDSKGAVGCHLDRHENIGKGCIGLDGFRRFMTDPRFDGIPMILETPLGDYAKEIKTLYKMTK